MSSGTRPDQVRPLRRDAELNRRRILEAAEKVFAERGLDASLDDVARQAGLGVATAYRRFANKEELIDALFEERIDDITVLAQQALAVSDSWQGLVGFVERLTELIAHNRGLREVLVAASYGQHKAAQARERLQPMIDRVVERAQADGHLRTDFATTDLSVISFMLGSAADYCQPIRPDVWRRYLTFVLDGLHARREGPTPLSAPPMDTDDVDAIMATWRPSRR